MQVRHGIYFPPHTFLEYFLLHQIHFTLSSSLFSGRGFVTSAFPKVAFETLPCPCLQREMEKKTLPLGFDSQVLLFGTRSDDLVLPLGLLCFEDTRRRLNGLSRERLVETGALSGNVLCYLIPGDFLLRIISKCCFLIGCYYINASELSVHWINPTSSNTFKGLSSLCALKMLFTTARKCRNV